jgi:hypothetical protein
MSACLQGREPALDGQAYSAMLEQVDEVRSRMLGFLRDFDVIVCPVTFGPARAHGDSLTDHFRQGDGLQGAGRRLLASQPTDCGSLQRR